MNKESLNSVYDILVLLSGPEPQRTLLEEKLRTELDSFNGKVLFVKGIVDDHQVRVEEGQFTIYNFMETKDLENTINQSKLVIARSGYSTIMDLAKLRKKAFFIPTPGQYEQEYLASYLQDLKLAPYCKQEYFNNKKLEEVSYYKGLINVENKVDFSELFSLFKSKRKFTTNA
jgi:uncharacterized protein (TIGR00661 family)